jgi:hypothetical protein
VIGLGIEGLELAGPTLHPENDAGHAAASQLAGLDRHQVRPAQRAGRDAGRGNAFEKVTPADDTIAADGKLHMSFKSHARILSPLEGRLWHRLLAIQKLG